MGQTKVKLQENKKAKTKTARKSTGKTQEVEAVQEVQKKGPKGPRKRGKNYVESAKQVIRTKSYKIKDAIALTKKISKTKFDPTIELHITVKKQDLKVSTQLPHASGKAK